jgi:hypothetical protein
MPRYSRLSPAGVSGRFFGVITAATGTMACGGTLAGVAGATDAAGSISSASTWTGVGSSTHRSTGDVLARGLFDAGVGASVITATGSISGLVQVVGSSGGHLGRLTGLGVTGRFFSPTAKESSVPRLWNVSETFGLGAAISDFTERRFFLIDAFGLNLAPTTAFTGAVGMLASATTWSGVSGATASVTGSVAIATAWSGVGQNVIINSGAGSLSVSVSFDGQGSQAGGVHGVGVGLIQETTAFSGVGRSDATADGSWSETATFAGVGQAVFTAVGSLSAVSSWSGDSTTFLAGTGAISFASSWTGASLSIRASSPNISITSSFNGVAIAPDAAPPRPNRIAVIRRVERHPLAKKGRRDRVA